MTAPPATSRFAEMAATVGQTAAAMTGQTAPLSNDLNKGRYVGFDTHTYPGTSVMRAWKSTPGSPYKWVGYYLPAPCHDDKSWVGKRDTLARMGWGVAIVYVGQQTWGKVPRGLTPAQRDALRKKNDCSTDLISADEGKLDADDATARAAAEGFAEGSIVFLDIERMQTVPPAMRDYYRAWAARMLANKKYKPGVYAHQFNAPQVFTDVKDAFAAAGDTSTPRMWIAGGKGFDTGRAPQDVGYSFAGVWQGVIDVARSVANIRLPVDVDVASWLSPSESGTATQ
ncbi:MAG: glycoside hydrolase domain-containing protein [Gemmatimonadaceae bacterium]